MRLLVYAARKLSPPGRPGLLASTGSDLPWKRPDAAFEIPSIAAENKITLSPGEKSRQDDTESNQQPSSNIATVIFHSLYT